MHAWSLNSSVMSRPAHELRKLTNTILDLVLQVHIRSDVLLASVFVDAVMVWDPPRRSPLPHIVVSCTLHSRLKICSEILYILAFSQQEYGKQSGSHLSIGCHYFQCSLDWLFINLTSTNKCTTNLSDFF
jgi:hypothetical protein